MIAKLLIMLTFAAIAIIIGLICQKHADGATGFFSAPLIASPINCDALATLLSLAVTPLVSLATKPVDFDMNIVPPSRKGATDREIEVEAKAEGLEKMDPIA